MSGQQKSPVALLDGTVTPASFAPEQLARTDTRRLIANMTILESDELTALWPEEWISVITIHASDGQTFQKRTGWPLGSPKNPATPQSLARKAHSLIDPHLGAEAVDRLHDRVAVLETWPVARELFDFCPKAS